MLMLLKGKSPLLYRSGAHQPLYFEIRYADLAERAEGITICVLKVCMARRLILAPRSCLIASILRLLCAALFAPRYQGNFALHLQSRHLIRLSTGQHSSQRQSISFSQRVSQSLLLSLYVTTYHTQLYRTVHILVPFFSRFAVIRV